MSSYVTIFLRACNMEITILQLEFLGLFFLAWI